jgi:hypothetical protein
MLIVCLQHLDGFVAVLHRQERFLARHIHTSCALAGALPLPG